MDDEATHSQMEAQDMLVGLVVDERYRVERVLGEGGMGRVYEVSDTTFHKRLVLKTLHPQFSDSKSAFDRFLREARAAASLGGPHIVEVSAFGRLLDGRAYYVMEHVDGVSLDEALEAMHGPMPVRRALEIARGIARAIGRAHEGGVVHRDLKPDNVLLCARHGRSDFVKVCDFGLAFVVDDGERITQQGEMLGSPYYMAPEQCTNAPVDQRADIYSIGVILYEMLTLELPFDSKAFAEVIRMKVMETPRRPSELEGCEHITPDIEELVLTCMAREPDKRFASHLDLMRALETILGEASSDTYPTVSGEEPTFVAGPSPIPPPPKPPPAAAPATPVPPPAAEASPTKRGPPVVGILIGLVLFLAVVAGSAGVGWYLSHRDRSPPPAPPEPTSRVPEPRAVEPSAPAPVVAPAPVGIDEPATVEPAEAPEAPTRTEEAPADEAAPSEDETEPGTNPWWAR